MENLNGLALPVSLNVVPQTDLWLSNSLPPARLEQALIEDLEAVLTPCAPGYVWIETAGGCQRQIARRSPPCELGYKKNIRLDECRRIKYNVGSQKKGPFRKWWDSHFESTTKSPPAPTTPPKTTLYTDGWFGYGYDHGRNDPHW